MYRQTDCINFCSGHMITCKRFQSLIDLTVCKSVIFSHFKEKPYCLLYIPQNVQLMTGVI